MTKLGCNNCKKEWEVSDTEARGWLTPCEECGAQSFYQVKYSEMDKQKNGTPNEKTTGDLQTQ